jgi:hypothetical protein
VTLSSLIQLAIDTAVAGTDPDASVVQKHRREAESLVPQCLDKLARDVAADRDLQARLMTEFNVSLSAGVGTIPSEMLLEYIHEATVVDSSTGNVLSRVQYLKDLYQPLFTAFDYYCPANNQFYTKQGSSGDLTAVQGPLLISAPFVPTKTGISTEIPSEIEPNLVELLAFRLRGMMFPMPPATGAAKE